MFYYTYTLRKNLTHGKLRGSALATEISEFKEVMAYDYFEPIKKKYEEMSG